MSKKIEEALRNWDNADSDLEDDLYRYFINEFNRWDWADIANEARRVWQLMFDEEIEDDSPVSYIFCAIAASAYNGAMASVAAAIGVDQDGLELAASHWYENQDALPPPVTTRRGLLALIKKVKKEIDQY